MWAFTLEGHTMRGDSLTLEQIGRLEKMLDESWVTLAPLKRASNALAYLTVMLSAATGEPEDVVRARVGKLTERDLLDAFSTVADDKPSMYESGNPPLADESPTS